MKRRTAFILALIMVLCVVLSACGSTASKTPEKESVTKEALIGGYRKKAEAQTATSYSFIVDMKLGVSVLGQSMDLSVNGDFKSESAGDKLHVYGTISTNAAGESEKEQLDVYSVKENDSYTVYTNTDGKWTKYSTPTFSKANVQALLYMQDTSSMEMTETDSEYIVNGTISLGDLMDAIKDYAGVIGDIGKSVDLTKLDLKGVVSAKTTYHFSKDTKEATGVDIDMTDCMQSLMEQIVKIAADMLGSQGLSSGTTSIDLSSFIKINAEKFVMSVKDIVFDSNLSINIPDAAKNAQEAALDINGDPLTGLSEFKVENMSIMLPSEYTDFAAEGYTKALVGSNSGALFLKEEKAILANYADSLSEYKTLVLKANEGRDIEEQGEYNGRPYFVYTYKTEDGSRTYKYLTTMYESSDSFWLVQFFSEERDFDSLMSSFEQWAETVSFDN